MSNAPFTLRRAHHQNPYINQFDLLDGSEYLMFSEWFALFIDTLDKLQQTYNVNHPYSSDELREDFKGHKEEV